MRNVIQVLSGPVNLVVKRAGRELGHLVDIFADPCRTLAKVNVTVPYYADVSPQAIDLGATIGRDWDDTVSAKALRSFDERGPIRCVLDENRGRRASGKTPERLPQFVKSTLRPELIPQQVIPSSQRDPELNHAVALIATHADTTRIDAKDDWLFRHPMQVAKMKVLGFDSNG